MLFNSPLFLFLFLPFAFSGFYICAWLGHRFAVGWLVAVSLIFYGWWTPAYLVLLCGSIAFNYTAGVLIQKTVERPALQSTILITGVTGNLFLLGYYKYLFPLLNWVGHFGLHLVPSNTSILLPLGISFFTFTQIGYLIDCKAGLTSGRRFLDYSLFVSFFPHLIAGPILHHREMMPQFESQETWRFRVDKFALGASIFFIGLAKKDVIADYFAFYANLGFANPEKLTFLQAWCSVFSYSMELYFDFSGYSEMAIGLALLFNIRFPANFDSPYKSTSVIEFWQRFHMTLTRYFTLYLYTPIALWITRIRTQKKLPVGRQGLKTAPGFLAIVAFPTFFTMTLIGIWHGAGFQFVIFGLLHGFYMTINHAWNVLFSKKGQSVKTGMGAWFSRAWKVALTYLAVVLAQIFFRSASVSDAFAMLTSMANRDPQAPVVMLGVRVAWEWLIVAFLFVWLAPNVLQIFAPWEPTLSKPHSPGPEWYQAFQWKPNISWAVAIGFVAGLAILAISGQTEFLYFRF